MRRYFASSAALHAAVLVFLLWTSFFNRGDKAIMINDIDFNGLTEGGRKGDGQLGGGNGLKKEKQGQVVPQPPKQVLPPKPAPVQKAESKEKAWAAKDEKTPKPEPVVKPTPVVPTGQVEKKEQSNIKSVGKTKDQKTGQDDYVFGTGAGSGGGEGAGSGRGVGVGFGPGEGTGFPFGRYLSLLRARIWSEWSQNAVYGSNESCVVGMTVAKDGVVTDIRLEQSSGNSFYDQVAMRAVRNASAPPLPADFPKPQQRFRIKFRLVE
jgi:protein TonB